MNRNDKKKWLIGIAAGVLLLVLLGRSGLGLALSGVARWLVPIGALYFCYRWAAKTFFPKAQDRDELERERYDRRDRPVIEICPSCGQQKENRHVCSEG